MPVPALSSISPAYMVNGDLPLARVRLAKDANYPWLVLVPRCAGVSELTDLPEDEQVQLLGEIATCAGALKATVPCDRLNVAALGNMVAQPHVHVVARTQNRCRLAEAGVGHGAAARL